MPKVVFFGNLPIWVGGRQTSGASVAMWQLAENMNCLQSEWTVDFVATDFFYERKKINNTIVYGWNYKVFVMSWLSSFMQCISLVGSVYKISKQNKTPFFSAYVKTVFFNTIVKKNRQALFHVHGADYFIILETVLKKNKIKEPQLLYTVHAIAGDDSNIPDYGLEKSKELQIAKWNLGQQFFVSKQLQEEWVGLYGQKESVVIPNGIDDLYLQAVINVLPLKKYDDEVKTLLTIGSITERKGQIRVLQALSHCKNKDTIIYQCIGSCEERYMNKLQEFANAKSINFEYLGIKDAAGIIEALYKAHYMILPSSSEGFGLVYLESLCTGTPVIVPRNLPIVKEINLDKGNAILLNDHTNSSVETVLNSIHSYSFNSQEILSSFNRLSWCNVAAMYLKQYKEVYEKGC